MPEIQGGSSHLDPLSLDIANSKIELAKLQDDRRHDGVQYSLQCMLGKVQTLSDEIMSVLSQSKSPAKALRELAANEIVRASDGNLNTPLFAPGAGAKQQVWMHVGTHWMECPEQQYYDFVRDAASKMGMPDSYADNATFVKPLLEQVAFQVARARIEPKHRGEVWVNLLNGTLVIGNDGSCNLRAHQRKDNFTYVLPFSYSPDASCPRWRAFLDQMLPETQAQHLLAEYCAYCLTTGIKMEKMLVFFGSGSNGKSVVLDVIEALFGTDNVSNVSLAELTEDDKKRAMIEGKRVNISHESDKGINASVMKKLVSCEPVTVYVNYLGPHTMYYYAKLITSFNILPKAENTHGFYRRFILMPWQVTISDKEADVHLAERIIHEELPGILNWMLEGMKRFLANGKFTESPMCKEALDKYKLVSDSVRMFLAERCIIGSSYPMSGQQLFVKYREYCSGIEVRPVGRNRFYDRLTDLGILGTDYQGQLQFNINIKAE